MSLLDMNKVACAVLDKKRVPDGEGGFYTEWTDGAKFKAAIVFDTSMQARTAEKQGVTSLFTVYTDKNVVLDFHDAFRRLYDGKIFRVTSDGNDKATPEGAGLDLRVVSAEEWEPTK